jgi:signal transduction histidine kinase
LRSDGEWAHIEDHAVIARDSSGKVTRVVGAMLDVTVLKAAEDELEQSNRRLQELANHQLRAQDYDRRRIARELHDSTGQFLTALGLNLGCLQLPGLEPERRRQLLAESSQLLQLCAEEIRTVTFLLHPPLLDELGLPSAVHTYIHGFSKRTGIEIEVNIPTDFGRLDIEMETAVFRIIQEGLANVHKHSGSRTAEIRLERDSQEFRLVLRDWGCGLSTALRNEQHAPAHFGIGVTGMRERAEQLGGKLEFTSGSIGARLAVTFPLVH